MDLFIENLDKIRKVVEFIVRDYNFRYEVDELINAAYVGYETAITNNPSLVYTQFNNIHILLNRVRFDIKDYIREERKDRVKQKMEKVGIAVPEFYNASFLPMSKGDKIGIRYIPDNEEGYESSDIRDTLDYLMANSGLKEVEKEVILLCFYEEKHVREAGRILGRSASGVNNLRRSAMEKIKDKVEMSCVKI